MSIEGSSVNLPTIPSISAAFIQIAHAAKSFTIQQRQFITSECSQAGSFNYKVLGQMVVGYNFDQLSRRYLIAQMAKGLSLSNDDFYDIDGQSGKQGIENTFRNNLTDANRESIVEFQVMNGFRQGNCYGSPNK